MKGTQDELRGAIMKAPSDSLVDQLIDRNDNEIEEMTSFWNVPKTELYNTLIDPTYLLDYFENRIDKLYQYRSYRVMELLAWNNYAYDFDLIPNNLHKNGLLCKYYIDNKYSYVVSNEIKYAWRQMKKPEFLIVLTRQLLVTKYVENTVFYFGIRSIEDIHKDIIRDAQLSIHLNELLYITQQKIQSQELACCLHGFYVCDRDYESIDNKFIEGFVLGFISMPRIVVNVEKMFSDHYDDYESKKKALDRWLNKNQCINDDNFSYSVFSTYAKRYYDFKDRIDAELRSHKRLRSLLERRTELLTYIRVLIDDIPCWELQGFSRKQWRQLQHARKRPVFYSVHSKKRLKRANKIMLNEEILENRYGI